MLLSSSEYGYNIDAVPAAWRSLQAAITHAAETFSLLPATCFQACTASGAL